MTWLSGTPQAVVAAHLEMMQRLQAEEAMTITTTTAIGRALKSGSWTRQQWSKWQRIARGAGHPRPADPGGLAGIGIGYVKVKRSNG